LDIKDERPRQHRQQWRQAKQQHPDISLELFILSPELIWNVGLSGVLHGLFVAGALGAIRRRDRRETILLAAIVCKLLWQQSFGALPGSTDMAGGSGVVDSRL